MKKGILFTFCCLSLHFLQAQVFNGSVYGFFPVSSPAPPIINFSPKPTRVLVAPLYRVEDLKIARDKKEDLVQECLDTLLAGMQSSAGLRNLAYELVRDTNPFRINGYPGDPKSIMQLLEMHQSDLLIAIDGFRPYIMQGDVNVSESYSGSKSKTADYFIVVDGKLSIFNRDSMLHEFPFRLSRFLKSRQVVSGLLAAGPSLVNNRESALALSMSMGVDLVEMLQPGKAQVSARLYTMKDLRELNRYIQQEDWASARAAVNILMESGERKVKGRAYYMSALLHQRESDYDAAYQDILKARALIDAEPAPNYEALIRQYISAATLVWKK